MIYRFLTLLAALFIPSLFHHLTLGFHPSKLQLHLADRLKWDVPPLSSQKQEEIQKIFTQTFVYFDLGSQSYAFQSQDGQYVLKLFRCHRSRFSLIQNLKYWIHGSQRKPKASLLTKIDKTFQACALAYREVPQLTQLVFVHLNLSPSGYLPNIKVIDPLGRIWHLPLNQFRFALQRKVEPFKKTLLTTYRSKNQEKMEHLLTSFLTLLNQRTSCWIRNSDPNIGPNFGFLNGEAVEIDCGNYRQNLALRQPEERRKEIARFASQVEAWLAKEAPEYVPYFHSQWMNL